MRNVTTAQYKPQLGAAMIAGIWLSATFAQSTIYRAATGNGIARLSALMRKGERPYRVARRAILPLVRGMDRVTVLLTVGGSRVGVKPLVARLNRQRVARHTAPLLVNALSQPPTRYGIRNVTLSMLGNGGPIIPTTTAPNRRTGPRLTRSVVELLRNATGRQQRAKPDRSHDRRYDVPASSMQIWVVSQSKLCA